MVPFLFGMVFALGLAAMVPGSAWRTIWTRSRSMRLVAAITGGRRTALRTGQPDARCMAIGKDFKPVTATVRRKKPIG